MKKVDMNGDGRISFNEFWQFYKSQQVNKDVAIHQDYEKVTKQQSLEHQQPHGAGGGDRVDCCEVTCDLCDLLLHIFCCPVMIFA